MASTEKKKRVISFSVDEKKYEEICEYAKAKGFGKPSTLAKKAIYHVSRYPVKSPKISRDCTGNEELSGGDE